jgi:hypothetical protein
MHRIFKKAASSALVIPPALQPNQTNDAGIAPTTYACFRKAHRTLGPPAAFLSHLSPAVLSSPPSRPITKTITQRSSVWNPSQNGCAVAFQDLVQLSRFVTRFLLSGTLRSSGRTEFVTRHHTRASRHGSVPSQSWSRRTNHPPRRISHIEISGLIMRHFRSRYNHTRSASRGRLNRHANRRRETITIL